MTREERKARRKEKRLKNKKLRRRIWLGIFLALLVVVNVVCLRLEVIITLFTVSPETKSEEVIKASNDNAKQVIKNIEAEGAVLLKNSNQVLPLTSDKVNIFGWGSVSPIYAGTGSGGGNEKDNINLQQGLRNAGLTVNDELTEFYGGLDFERVNAGPLTGFQPDLHVYEADITDYSDTLLDNAVAFSDTAIVMISRSGGEASDIVTDMAELDGDEGRHMLELTSKEESMLEMVKDRFENVVVLVNAANPMELGFTEDGGVDAVLWIGDPGATGFESVGKILTGEINPSGALSDTYAYDATSAPSYENFGAFSYSNSKKDKYVEYAEGIYVGYRYYETRYIDNATGECDEAAYRSAVQFPFGYGLSYTTFEQSISSFGVTDDTVTVDIDVTNTGDVAGKDIVQIYLTAPYYAGGIEKSHVELVGFDKTEELAPGASETIHIEMKIEDFASYDYINEKAYVLDQGTYEIKLMDNAHDLIEAREFEIAETTIFDESSPRSTDEVAATNLFDDVAGDIVYLSRADWEGTMPVDVSRTKEVSEEIIDAIHSTDYEVDDSDEDIIVADHGITFAEMKGVDYDDPKWDEFLEQLSVEEMSQLIGLGGYQTMPVKSIDKGITSDVDGPAGINAIVNGQSGITHATEVVLASTFNVELAAEMGNSLASQADAYSIDGIYAPAMNIHRSPFSGRNFEYYSEDPYLSGVMGAAEITAIRDAGKYCYVKHFALNDQETNRNGVSTWSNEQAMREIYLKPFEYAVKEGGATAMMSAFVRLGTVWCGANYDLLTNVLRNEWGFHGMVITDYDGMSYMNVDQAIRAGNDIMLSTLGDEPRDKSNTGKQAMRNASHNILYTVVNSNASTYTYEYIFPTWKIFLFGFDAVVAIFIVVSIIVKRKKKASEM